MKEKGNFITDNQKLANLFNTYFINITDTLKLKKSPLKFQSLTKIISFYENHGSISKIKEKKVSSNKVKKILKTLNRKKSAISSCISVSILIDSMDIYLPLLTDIINDSVKRGIFPDELKLAEIISLFKKADPFDKTNYRPISLLSLIFQKFLKE